jgi:hypothetical protein
MQPSTECNVGWLLFVLRAERRRQRRYICVGSDADEEFRQGVRKRLAEGRLFLASGVSTLRRGTGRPCIVCGKAITDTQEHEVEGDGLAPVALAHPDCYRVWREELTLPTETRRLCNSQPLTSSG